MIYRLVAEIACTLMLIVLIAAIYARQASITSLMISSLSVDVVSFTSRTKLYSSMFTINKTWELIEMYEDEFNHTLGLFLVPAFNITFIPTATGSKVIVRTWSKHIIPFLNITVLRIITSGLTDKVIDSTDIEYKETETSVGEADFSISYNSSDIYVIFVGLYRFYTYTIVAPENITRQWYVASNTSKTDYIEVESGITVNRTYLIIPHYKEPVEANWTQSGNRVYVDEEPGTVAYILTTDTGEYFLVNRLPIPYIARKGSVELFKYLICNIDNVNYMLAVEVRKV